MADLRSVTAGDLAATPITDVARRERPVATATRPRVTVVTACYNYAHFLPDAVESVMAQQGVDVDVVVVNDGSPDDTQAVAEALAERHGRLTVLRNETNQGYLAAFNRGFSHATGEYLVKLDADDALPPGALHRAVSLMAAHPSVGYVYGTPLHFGGPGLPVVPERTRRPDAWTVWPGAAWVADRCRRGVNVVSNPEVVMRRETFVEAGNRLNPRLGVTCDFELWLRLASLADVGRVEGHYQGLYRIHAASMQRTVNAGQVVDLRGRRDAFRELFADPVTAGLPQRDVLAEVAFRRLADEAVDKACHAYDRRRVETTPTDEFLALADDMWPQWRDSAMGRRLARRERIGPRRAWLTPLALRSVRRRVGWDVTRRRWRREGL